MNMTVITCAMIIVEQVKCRLMPMQKTYTDTLLNYRKKILETCKHFEFDLVQNVSSQRCDSFIVFCSCFLFRSIRDRIQGSYRQNMCSTTEPNPQPEALMGPHFLSSLVPNLTLLCQFCLFEV